MNEQDKTAETAPDENKLIAERRAKLEELREQRNPFPNDFRRTAMAADLQAEYGDQAKEQLEQANREFAVAGRLVRNRGAFLLIQDGSDQIQLYVNRKGLDEDTLAEIKSWDLGDIVGARGPLHKSGKGDLYINMDEASLLTKALRPLPDKYHGLADQELRYRQRYVDLIVNPESRQVFRTRSRITHDAGHSRRCCGQAFCYPPQCPEPGYVPAHRAGAVPEAAGGRRFREGV
jgi:lysyl-tRNA synthetase class 2